MVSPAMSELHLQQLRMARAQVSVGLLMLCRPTPATTEDHPGRGHIQQKM
jgi:hypothetical protein